MCVCERRAPGGGSEVMEAWLLEAPRGGSGGRKQLSKGE